MAAISSFKSGFTNSGSHDCHIKTVLLKRTALYFYLRTVQSLFSQTAWHDQRQSTSVGWVVFVKQQSASTLLIHQNPLCYVIITVKSSLRAEQKPRCRLRKASWTPVPFWREWDFIHTIQAYTSQCSRKIIKRSHTLLIAKLKNQPLKAIFNFLIASKKKVSHS